MREQEAMILRSEEKLCTAVSEMRDKTVKALLEGMHQSCFDLDVVRGGMHRATDCRKLAQHEGECTTVEKGFGKSRSEQTCEKGTRGSGVLQVTCLRGAAKAGAAGIRTEGRIVSP